MQICNICDLICLYSPLIGYIKPGRGAGVEFNCSEPCKAIIHAAIFIQSKTKLKPK